jgi:hypothetical protein
MTKSNITLVPASRVRAAFAEGLFTAPEVALPSLVGRTPGKVRGRLHPEAVAAFNEQVKGEQYAGEKSAVESKRVTLPLTNLKRPEAFPLSEVRSLAGVTGKKGRLSAAEVATATQAVITARGWDQKPTKAAPKAKSTKVATVKVPTEG